MAKRKDRPELTWPGKSRRAKPAPEVLVEDSVLSRRAAAGGYDDNRLIHGDNLAVLQALHKEFAGEIKCVYLDPPFNTGAAFAHFDDGIEHARWLGDLRPHLRLLHALLRDDGVLWLHLDDNEAAYAKVLLDEVFGRSNYRNTVTVKANSPFGFKHTSDSVFKSAQFILAYAKSPAFRFNRVMIERAYDPAYRFVLENRDASWKKWRWSPIRDVAARENGFSNPGEAHKRLGKEAFAGLIAAYAVANAASVFRTAAVTGGARRKRLETLKKSALDRKTVHRHPGDDMDYYFIAGERILFYSERLVEIDGERLPGEALTDIWTDVSWEGIAREGGVDFPRAKKPEKLLDRILRLSTGAGDWVLDSYAGSGTTGAVAHKTGRRWIMVERGEQCQTHIVPRLERVIAGADHSGVSEAAGWTGGGGYRYFSSRSL